MRRQHPYHYSDKLLLPFGTKSTVLGGSRFPRPASFVNLRTRYSPYLKLMGNNTPTNQQERRPRKRRTPPKTVLFVQDSMIWLSVALLTAQNQASRDFPLPPKGGCARVGGNNKSVRKKHRREQGYDDPLPRAPWAVREPDQPLLMCMHLLRARAFFMPFAALKGYDDIVRDSQKPAR